MSCSTLAPLWPHQEEAIRFAEPRDACYLDMVMGAGKSRVALELLERWDTQRVLIVCPKSVIGVWRREYARWRAQRKLTILDRGNVARKAEIAAAAQAVCVNYESAWKEPLGALLRSRQWDCIVFDEAHRIGSQKARVSRWSWGLKAKHKLCLSGTPMDNPLNLWSQFLFLDGGRTFGNRFHPFRMRYATTRTLPGVPVPVVVGYKNLHELSAKFRESAFRVDQEALNLLPATMSDVPVTLSPACRRTYKRFETAFYADVDKGHISADNALVHLLRLQQITSGYVPNDDGESLCVSQDKQDALIDILKDLPESEQVVVFARFHTDLDQIMDAADKLRRPFRELSGRRQTALNDHAQLEDVPGQLVGVQMRAGSVGVDLSRAAYAVYFTLGFSLRDYQQSLARLHRPGQNRHVTFLRLVAEDSVDAKVVGALEAKGDIVRACLRKERGTQHGQ